ncbi:MAG: outer membrane beta-barrel protein [Ignavibacteriae bacterium]|nr:outer membrane beta-barrel protein [Ignavibacteriota bacterium]
MKKVITLFLMFVFISGLQTAKSEGDPDKPLFNKYGKSELLSKKELDYNKAKKEFQFRSGKIIDFYVDFQLGVGGTSANVTSASGVQDYKTASKLGFKTGALFYVALFDMFSFSSGLSFNGKSFELTNPNIKPPVADTTFKPGSTMYVTANYLNIPLNIHLGGKLTETFEIDFNGGPYLGIRMSVPDNVSNGSGFKNFDLGLNGTITGAYTFAYPLSAIVGVDLQYGGLNNLGSTATVERISMLNYTFFSGLRVGF